MLYSTPLPRESTTTYWRAARGPSRRAPAPGPPREVSRTALVNRLRAGQSVPLASIVAPAGYGKTTLLEQWSARDARAFSFVELDAPRTDAAVLVAAVARAIDGLVPAEPARRSTRDWIWTSAVPVLARSLREATRPFALVLDDAQLLSEDAAEVLTALVHEVPDGSMIVLAGRSQPLPSLPRLRVGGAVLELGAEDLAFSAREARLLLNSLGIHMGGDQLDVLLRTTEGWAAAIVAAAHSLGSSEPAQTSSPFAELLAGLAPQNREFLLRTSVLENLCAPLCDAVLERRDSAAILSALEASSMFVVPLDRDRAWSRYHRGLREHLRHELREREPELVPLLERRAADWFEATGDHERALGHACAAGDADRLARLLIVVASTMHNAGRAPALLDWITRFEETAELDSFPRIATLAGRLNALFGNVAEAERCLAEAKRGASRRRGGKHRDLDEFVRARITVARAAMCPDGVESMLADVEAAVPRLPNDHPWRPYALLLQGSAHALLGDGDRGDAILSRAVHAAERLSASETYVVALTERSLLAAARGAPTGADHLLKRALETMASNGLETYPTCALTLAVSARSQLLHRHAPETSAALAMAGRLTASLGPALPWLAVQTRLELASTHVTLRNAGAARQALAEIDGLLAGCPNLGVLRRRRDELAAEIDAMPADVVGATAGLTAAELRLLPMLATHLSFREIGARFYLSRNTVKTQAISVYRKLGASSRSEAVLKAQRLGLVGNGADVLIPAG